MIRAHAFALAVGFALAAGGDAVAASRAESRAVLPPRPLGAFTPSLIDAPGLALRPGATVDARQFRFTPSGKRGAARAVTLGVRARPVTLPETVRGGEALGGYDLGVAVGARGLALSGSMRRMDAGVAQREAVTLGLGYGLRDWTTTLRVGEEQGWARSAAMLAPDKRYSVELGGAYALGRDVSVGAGVRYRVTPDAPVAAATSRAPADKSAFVGLGIAF